MSDATSAGNPHERMDSEDTAKTVKIEHRRVSRTPSEIMDTLDDVFTPTLRPASGDSPSVSPLRLDLTDDEATSSPPDHVRNVNDAHIRCASQRSDFDDVSASPIATPPSSEHGNADEGSGIGNSVESLLLEVRRLGLENNPMYSSITRKRSASGRVEDVVVFNNDRVQCEDCNTWFAGEAGYRIHWEEKCFAAEREHSDRAKASPSRVDPSSAAQGQLIRNQPLSRPRGRRIRRSLSPYIIYQPQDRIWAPAQLQEDNVVSLHPRMARPTNLSASSERLWSPGAEAFLAFGKDERLETLPSVNSRSLRASAGRASGSNVNAGVQPLDPTRVASPAERDEAQPGAPGRSRSRGVPGAFPSDANMTPAGPVIARDAAKSDHRSHARGSSHRCLLPWLPSKNLTVSQTSRGGHGHDGSSGSDHSMDGHVVRPPRRRRRPAA